MNNVHITRGFMSRMHGPVHGNHFQRLAQKLLAWDGTMARKTYRIEIKIDFSDDDRHTQMTEVALETARAVGRRFFRANQLEGRRPG